MVTDTTCSLRAYPVNPLWSRKPAAKMADIGLSGWALSPNAPVRSRWIVPRVRTLHLWPDHALLLSQHTPALSLASWRIEPAMAIEQGHLARLVGPAAP